MVAEARTRARCRADAAAGARRATVAGTEADTLRGHRRRCIPMLLGAAPPGRSPAVASSDAYNLPHSPLASFFPISPKPPALMLIHGHKFLCTGRLLVAPVLCEVALRPRPVTSLLSSLSEPSEIRHSPARAAAPGEVGR